jgi:hypothetical protein
MPAPHKGTIKSRNMEDCIEAEVLLWRAMCDKPESLRKYIAKDAVLALPGEENKIYSPDTEPSISELLDDFQPWTTYKMHDDPEFVEIDMMSCCLTYRVTVWNGMGKDAETIEAVCSSVWRQGAGGDWQCCMHHMTQLS